MSTFDFGTITLPYGIFAPLGEEPRVGVAVGTMVLDLSVLIDSPEEFAQASLNPFMSAGSARWAEVRLIVTDRVAQGVDVTQPGVHHQGNVEVGMPFEVADFVDFFSGIEHATNAGQVLRPGEESLKPNYRHLPVGYHGRAGTVVPSGSDVYRPTGQVKRGDDVVDEPSSRLDFEVELGYVVGRPSTRGVPVTVDRFADHVFGVVLLIDWSARDIQAWEYQPLGPFLGKSFATSISSWVAPLAALDDAWADGPEQTPPPLPYLRAAEPRNPVIGLELDVQSVPLSRLSAESLYWSPAQQMAHMVHNGASLRTGDLYGTGTISSFDPAGQGSMLEISWGGTRTVDLGAAGERTFLEDDDVVTLRGHIAGSPDRPLGEVVGTIRSRHA